MLLSKDNIAKIAPKEDLVLPQPGHLELPEKVLEFGTGVLLRGLPNYFIDKANKKGLFNGRVVVVKSTDRGTTEAFDQQNSLYTLCVRGIEDGKQVDKKVVNSSISRVLSAQSEWGKVVQCAANRSINIIVSNVTEAGFKLDKEDQISHIPPRSFPGKLLAWLYERYRALGGTPDSGVVVLPTELIPDNGKLLKSMLLELAEIHQLPKEFMVWLDEANDFCNTLVDRIVPGALPANEHSLVEQYLGVEDQLMIMAEPYRLWAIETNRSKTKEVLSFASADPGVVIAKNINLHREIKIRLLNAPHTASCAYALFKGFRTVKEAMNDKEFKGFISELMYHEITPILVDGGIPEEEARVFAGKVLDRFSNPYIAHEWLSISMQYTSKMATRCIPLLQAHYKKNHSAPRCMAMGFAAYLLFMKSEQNKEGKYEGNIGGAKYLINDDKAAAIHEYWKKYDLNRLVYHVLKDQELWGVDLTELPDFKKAVVDSMELMVKETVIK